MNIDGSCLCGHIPFVADIDPDKVRICHCTDRQAAAELTMQMSGRVHPEVLSAWRKR